MCSPAPWATSTTTSAPVSSSPSSFYQEIRDEIDAMYLLFYSNSTRKAFLRLNHPLIYQVYQEHYSLRALKILPLFKSIYISLSLLLRKTLS